MLHTLAGVAFFPFGELAKKRELVDKNLAIELARLGFDEPITAVWALEVIRSRRFRFCCFAMFAVHFLKP